MSEFKDKIVLVTGGATGLGAAIAIGTAKGGAKAVIINCTKSLKEAGETAAAIRAAGADAVIAQGDVSQDADCRRIAAAAAPYGRLDILVNNAGTTKHVPKHADLDGLYPRWAILRLFLGVRRPRIPWLGLDAVGVVEGVGAGVTRFKPGDRVFADLSSFGQKAFSELVAAPGRAWLPVPEGMDDETAATLPHSGVLAVQGLRRGRLVHEASADGVTVRRRS